MIRSTITDTMTAAVLHKPGDLRLEETPVPKISSTDILIRVKAALTCGTDQKAFVRGHPKIRIPGPLGHEFAGDIAAIGDEVTEFEVGDSVACVHTAPCGECYYCDRDSENLCIHLIERMAYGAYAEYIRIPRHVYTKNCLPLPHNLNYVTAALTEPLACCVYGMRRIAVQPGETVLILGDGPIGLMFVRLALHAGASRVVVVGRSSTRLAVAEQFGAAAVYLADSVTTPGLIRDEFPPYGPDVVIECVGRPHVWQQALASVRPAGRLLVFGGCPPGKDVPLDVGKIHYSDITLIGAFHFTPRDVRQALHYLAQGVVDPNMMITEEVPLKDIGRFFDLNPNGGKNYLKVAFIP